MTVLVSICVQTYQHSKFINKCLDSILSQKTTFSYEVLLGEDCSTDGTREICMEYAEKYPDRIKLFLHSREDNIHVDGKPTGKFNFINNYQHSQGKYIAICEGDDYWTDPDKLQKQVDFMENNPEFSLCFHAVEVLNYNGNKETSLVNEQNSVTNIFDLARYNYIHTVSVLYRNCLPDGLPEFLNFIPAGDYPLHLLMAQYGKIKYFPEKMAVYRVHDGGRWSSQDKQSKHKQWLVVLEELIKYFSENQDVRRILFEQKMQIIIELLEHYKKTGDKNALKILTSNMLEDNASIFTDWLLSIHKEKIEKNVKYNRIRNHIILGKIIDFYSLIKRDSTF